MNPRWRTPQRRFALLWSDRRDANFELNAVPADPVGLSKGSKDGIPGGPVEAGRIKSTDRDRAKPLMSVDTKTPAIAVSRPFAAPYAPADEAIAARLLAQAPRSSEAEARIDARATRLIEGIRAHSGGIGGIEDFLHAYSLSTKEGLALMVLAEALLRV